jgi:hypothetical protein
MAIKLVEKKTRKPGSGRPKGNKTRPDSPRMIRARIRRERLDREKAAKLNVAPVVGQTLPNTPIDSAPSVEIVARPDTELFGVVKLPTETRQNIRTELPETDLNADTEKNLGGNAGDTGATSENSGGNSGGNGLPDDDAETKAAGGSPEDHRGLATVIWDSIVGLFVMFFGAFWFPRKVGRNPENNEIPFDEREMVVSAFCKYFESIGLKALSPLQELFCVIGAYCLPRLRATVEVIRFKFMKKAKPAPAQPAHDSRMPENPSTQPAKPPETPPPAPAPAESAPLDAVAQEIIHQQQGR